jgi:hypothetical protein
MFIYIIMPKIENKTKNELESKNKNADESYSYYDTNVLENYLCSSTIQNICESFVYSDKDKDIIDEIISSQKNIDNIIEKNNYIVTTITIELACKKLLNIDIISHLLSYKIIMDCDSVNRIIYYYIDNEDIGNLLELILQYGYTFKESNYHNLLSIRKTHYEHLFTEKIVAGLCLDDKIMDYFTNEKCHCHQDYYTFIENFEKICHAKNGENIEKIVALYCSKGNTEKIKDLCKKYKFKLTPYCLKYLYTDKANISIKNINLFKKHCVKPDYEVLKQYIKLNDKKGRMYDYLQILIK